MRLLSTATYVYWCNNLRCTFLPARLLCTPTYVYWWNLRYTFLPGRLLCTPQMLDYEGGKHIAPRTAGATTYAVLFFQRGCCAHPQTVNYECGKHIAPHTYTNATAYAVLFFQQGYSAHPQILDYKAGNTQPPTHTLVQQPVQLISCCTFF